MEIGYNQQLANIPIIKKEIKSNTETVAPVKQVEKIEDIFSKKHIVFPNRNNNASQDISIMERIFLFGSESEIQNENLFKLIGKEISVVSDKWDFYNAEFTPNGFKIVWLLNAKVICIQELEETNNPVYFQINDETMQFPSIAFLTTVAEAEKITKYKPETITVSGTLNIISYPLRGENVKIVQLHRFR